MKAWAQRIEVLWKETRWKNLERREEEQKGVKNDVRDVGFAGLKACGGLRDQVCIHQADRVASEILDWSQRARAQRGKKKENVPGKPDNPPMTNRVFRSTSANCDQPTKEIKSARLHAASRTNQTQMQTAQQGDPYVKQKTLRDGGEGAHEKCRKCAQTRPFDKATIFLTQQCPAADQTNWMVRIQQLKSEMGIEQQERAGDMRSLLGLQANTPRPKEKDEDETPRRTINFGSESRGPNLMLETDAPQKRHERLKLRAKCRAKGSRERETFTGLWWKRKFSDVSSAEKPRSSTKATVMFQQRCMTAKQQGWWDKVASEIRDWSQRARAQHGKKKSCQESRITFR